MTIITHPALTDVSHVTKGKQCFIGGEAYEVVLCDERGILVHRRGASPLSIPMPILRELVARGFDFIDGGRFQH